MRDCKSIHRFLTKTWCLPEVPSAEEIFNRVTQFNFGQDSEALDMVRFHDELEAAKLELQRRNNIKRGQFSEMLGDSDNFNGEQLFYIFGRILLFRWR